MAEQQRAPRPCRACIILQLLVFLTGTAAAQDAPSDREVGKPEPAEPIVRRGIFAEPPAMGKGIEFVIAKARRHTDGFYPELANMITGAGWTSIGPGYRHHVTRRVFVDASMALSSRGYKMAQARIEMPRLAGDRLTIGSRVMWQDLTQVNYFGTGRASLESQRSNYRLRNTDLMAYATLRLNR